MTESPLPGLSLSPQLHPEGSEGQHSPRDCGQEDAVEQCAAVSTIFSIEMLILLWWPSAVPSVV